eukprot:1116137-Prymnesium_polylepis.1
MKGTKLQRGFGESGVPIEWYIKLQRHGAHAPHQGLGGLNVSAARSDSAVQWCSGKGRPVLQLRL